MQIIEICKNLIKDIDFKNIESVSILAIAVCVLFVQILKAIYITPIEELFIMPKKKETNMVLKMIMVSAIMVIVNFVLTLDVTFLVPGVILFIATLLIGKYFSCKAKIVEANSQNNDLDDLLIYYKEKGEDYELFSTIIVMPILVLILNILAESIPLYSCNIIVSVVLTFFIFLKIPGFVQRESRLFFMKDNEKKYIYGRIDDENILCGDNTKMAYAQSYITISYQDLKNTEIKRQPSDGKLDKSRKKQLKRENKKRLCDKHRLLDCMNKKIDWMWRKIKNN